MKYNKKSKLIIAISVVLLGAAAIVAMGLGASVGTTNSNPPKIYISAEEVETKSALTGSYSWKYLSRNVASDSDHPMNFKYQFDNIVNTGAKQQIVIGTQNIKVDKKYDFTIDQISVYKDGQPVEFESPEPRFMNGRLYLQTPLAAGEYIYCLILNFKDKGIVNYGFVVRVDMATYNLDEISKHRTTYIGNHVKVGSVVSHLPKPDGYFKQRYTSMRTSEKPYILTVYYEANKGASHSSEWPIANPNNNPTYSNLHKNALVLFCMVDNLDEVTFAFRDSESNGSLDESKYDISYTFLKADLEEKYGDLLVLGKDLDLLQNALTGF